MSNDDLKKLARKRHAETVARIEAAMIAIEQEITASGRYVRGRLSKSEVCRRAGTTINTIKNPWHHETSKKVDAFLCRVKARKGKRDLKIRDADASEVTLLREAVNRLATELQLSELEKIDLAERLRVAERKLENPSFDLSAPTNGVLPIRRD